MTYSDEQQSPFTERKFIVAAVIVAAIVVVAVVVILINRGNGGSTDAELSPAVADSHPSAASPGPSESADPAASACGLPAGDQAIPTSVPQATWELVGTTAMPTAKDFGPGLTSDEGIHSCYAHSPTGALFAVAGAVADIGNADDSVAMLEQRTVPSEAREQAIARAKQEAAEQNSDMPDGYGGTPIQQIAGFQFGDVTEDRVTVMIALRWTSGQTTALRSAAITMQWHEGDWRAAMRSDGQIWTDVRAIDSLSGFVPWSGA